MSMDSQGLILTAIEKAISRIDGITLIRDPEYANTGTLRTLDRSLRQIGAVNYDFQQGYCMFRYARKPVASHWYGQSAEGKASWVAGSIPDLVEVVVEHLLKEAAA
jgi:hypothetical protein